jgi:hypothetical protein
MKTKTIQKILKKKINSWADTITDKDLQKMVRRDTIVTGGCIASMLLKEKVNDYDVYFKNAHTALMVAKYYVKQFNLRNNVDANVVTEEEEGSIAIKRIKIMVKSDGVAEDKIIEGAETIADVYEETEDAALAVEDNEFRPLFLSTNAITLSDKVQVIIRFWGTPDELHSNYDFVHCMNYWDHGNSELVLRQEALECLLTRELRYVGSKYPLCSIVRLRKFISRNWTVNAGQILKMCMQLNDLDLKDPKVLEEQLTGVDMAYFAEILAKVNEKDPARVDAAYLCTIIDRMF